jgi:hypothetical protein
MQSLNLSFNATTLRDRMESLPEVPPWKLKVLSIPGYETVEPIDFYYRDTAAVAQQLFQNPVYKDRIALAPSRVYSAITGKRRYGTMMTGNYAWNVAVCYLY